MIADLSFTESLPSVLYTLSLNRNALTELENGILDRLNNLYELRLQNNMISNIGNEVFRNNINLHTIDLSNNRISHISWGTFNISSYMNLNSVNLNDNPVSCVQTTAEIFLNFTWNDWMSIHNDIRIPQSCIHTPVHSHNYWYNINDIRILYFTGCNEGGDLVKPRNVIDHVENHHGDVFVNFLSDANFGILNGRYKDNKFTCILTKERKTFDRLNRKFKIQFQSQERQKLEEKLDETNQRDLWKTIENLGIASKRKRCIPLAVVDEDVHEATDTNIVLNKWKNDFQTLFHQNGNSDSDLDESKFNTEVDVSPLNEPISREEV
ncbi:Hypothetical predicted protein [Mytilus galloprovincialis]|nr:Hypothetical predicted protein [Mytilus galloprovincialis]